VTDMCDITLQYVREVIDVIALSSTSRESLISHGYSVLTGPQTVSHNSNFLLRSGHFSSFDVVFDTNEC